MFLVALNVIPHLWATRDTCGHSPHRAPIPSTPFGLHHPPFPTTLFLNSPPLGQADRPAHHEPQRLIQGEPARHPLQHTRVNSGLRRPVPRHRAPNHLPPCTTGSFPRPSPCTHRLSSAHKCLLLSHPPPTALPTSHQAGTGHLY